MRLLILKAMLILVAANATFYAIAQDSDVEIAHLCKEGEEVVFSCMTGKKNISFCATPRYTADKGHMTYRFGVIGNLPEMEYPNRPTSVGKAFRVSSLVQGLKSGNDLVVLQSSLQLGQMGLSAYSDYFWVAANDEEMKEVA